MLISLIDMAIVYFDIIYAIFRYLSPLTLRIKSSLLCISLVPAMCYVSVTPQCKTNEHHLQTQVQKHKPIMLFFESYCSCRGNRRQGK